MGRGTRGRKGGNLSTHSYGADAFLCLDEDDMLGVKCAKQCEECRLREEHERNGVPPEDVLPATSRPAASHKE